MIFDIETIGDDYGNYMPQDDAITIYLGTLYHSFLKEHNVTLKLLYAQIEDVMIHESIHKAIDLCLEGKPQEIDDHKIFKYLIF